MLTDGAVRQFRGREFQSLGAATEKRRATDYADCIICLSKNVFVGVVDADDDHIDFISFCECFSHSGMQPVELTPMIID